MTKKERQGNCFPSESIITDGSRDAVVVERFKNVIFVHFKGEDNKQLLVWKLDEAIENGWKIKPDEDGLFCPCCGN